MPTSSFPIQGVTPGDGGVAPRQEIDSWYQDPENARQVALFVVALKKFKELDPLGKDGKDPKLSYYQIAGPHSRRTSAVMGRCTPPPEGEKGVQTGGYCAHNISTFPTWHRPYLLLFEQRIWEIMKDIVSRFQASDHELALWRNAANTWRLPYWNWSTEQVPEAVTTGEMKLVEMPLVQAEEVLGKLENPLHKFTNPSLKPMGDESMKNFAIPYHNDGTHGTYPWDRCISTSRWGVVDKISDPKEQWVHGVVNNDKVNVALKSNGWYYKPGETVPKGTIKDLLHKLFARKGWKSWETFATTRYDKTSGKPHGEEFLSLEYIHNNIHNWAGGQWMNNEGFKDRPFGAGHMSDVDVAAFDPIFYLHHCNIDRLLAIWQLFNPELWFNKPQEDEPKPSDPLLPFYQDTERKPWTSDACRDITKLHYSYDDLKKPKKGRKEVEGANLLDELRKSINREYGVARGRVLGDKHGIAGLKNDYIVNVVYDRFAYDGAPYTIYFFLGKPEEEGATCIGSVYNFSSSRRSQEGSCDNCQQQRANGTLCRALVPITIPLLDRAQSTHHKEMGSLVSDVVTTELRDHLEWRVVVGGIAIDATKKDVQGLTVFAMQGTADHYKDETKLSEYHDYQVIVEATEGKANGLKDKDESPAAPPRPAHGEEL